MEEGVKKRKILAGMKVELKDAELFTTPSFPTSLRKISGVFYVLTGADENGRYAITARKQNVGKKLPIHMVAEGYVSKDSLQQ